MKITFGVSAGQMTENQWINLVTSIEKQRIPDYEIIMVGPEQRKWGFENSIRYIEFDEHLNGKAWITKKKNLITENAAYENVVYMHDYFILDDNWYKGWREYGPHFEIAMNCVLIQEQGTIYRHSDWVIDPFELWKIYPAFKNIFWDVSLPYDIKSLTPIQYISGGYWMAKRYFMEDNPLDETLAWGDAEDIEWSGRIRQKTTFKFNPSSISWIAKSGKWKPGIIPPEYLNKLCQAHNLEILREL